MDEEEWISLCAPRESRGICELWAVFQEKALQLLKEANGALRSFKDGVILWTSELTKPFNIEKYEHISPFKKISIKNRITYVHLCLYIT